MQSDGARERLNSLLLAMGPDDTHVYAMGTPFSGSEGIQAGKMPKGTSIPEGTTLHWAAFGPTDQCYYLCFWNKTEDTYHCAWGDEIPPTLRNWLKNVKGTRQKDRQARFRETRVVFGPKDSFLAWDRDSVRWSNLHPDLEEALQSWITRTGWKHGLIRHATLGCEGSYYITLEQNVVVFQINPKLKQLLPLASKWIDKGAHECTLQRVCLSPCNPDHFIVIDGQRKIMGNYPASGGLSYIADYLYTPEERTIRRQARDEARQKVDQNARDGYRRAHEGQADENLHRSYPWRGVPHFSPASPPPEPDSGQNEHAAEADSGPKAQTTYADIPDFPYSSQSKRHRQNGSTASIVSESFPQPKKRKPDEMTGAYTMWKAHCESLFSSPKPIVFFPQLPTMSCKCQLRGCQEAKATGALKACKHEVEAVLRASSEYSLDWLRKQRIQWHPDMFGRKCAVHRRETLCLAAHDLFVIMGSLMDGLQSKR